VLQIGIKKKSEIGTEAHYLNCNFQRCSNVGKAQSHMSNLMRIKLGAISTYADAVVEPFGSMSTCSTPSPVL